MLFGVFVLDDGSAGVINVAKACLEAKVPRLVVVSSGGVASPDSSIYKFLNLFGEVRVRRFFILLAMNLLASDRFFVV